MTEDRLRKIEAQQAETLTLLKVLTEKVDDRIEQDDVRYQRYARLIYGENGKKDAPGFLVRIDRLEQANERYRWLQRAITGAVVTLLAGAAWALLSS